MATLVTADLHFAENPRDAYRFVFFEETLPRLIEEHGVSRILVLGDLTESKAGHSPYLVNRIVDGFAALAEKVDVVVLKGNHDFLAEDVPFYRFLRHLDRVRWVNEPTALKLRGLGDCLFLPYAKNLSDWPSKQLADPDDYDWFFCHQTFKGADLGHEFKAEGLPPPFPKNARVVSGDVHVPQKIGPVTYVGSPTTIDFGDSFEPRVLLLEEGKMRSIPVAGPQKHLIVISGTALRTDPLGIARALRIGDENPFGAVLNPIRRGDVVKVRVELPAGSDLSRAGIRAEVRAWADAAGVDLCAVQVTAPPVEGGEKKRTHPQRSDEQLVRAYAKKMGQGKMAVAAGLKIVEDTP